MILEAVFPSDLVEGLSDREKGLVQQLISAEAHVAVRYLDLVAHEG
ncbi:hypothetical protein [Salinispora cortesiana]|nr:hypothetical protein [Salinispora cortesiana]